ncbi:long-subunit acyl-CoA synthetase (AMP-forming) [Polaromonas sp. CG_9.11]|nr:long-subunit acyl-CoA synthetase (AMP-forming) [Polaromonas sp. CG_9.11]
MTHANVVSNVLAILARVVPTADDVFLSFLPLSHTFERMTGYLPAAGRGLCAVGGAAGRRPQDRAADGVDLGAAHP